MKTYFIGVENNLRLPCHDFELEEVLIVLLNLPQKLGVFNLQLVEINLTQHLSCLFFLETNANTRKLSIFS